MFSFFNTKKRAVEALFRGRPSYSYDQFYEKYFMEKGVPQIAVQGVREVLEEVLDVDLSRLTNKDDFSNNLKFFWDFDSMADVEIVIELEKKFGIEIEDREAAETSTIEEIVMLVWGKMQTLDAR